MPSDFWVVFHVKTPWHIGCAERFYACQTPQKQLTWLPAHRMCRVDLRSHNNIIIRKYTYLFEMPIACLRQSETSIDIFSYIMSRNTTIVSTKMIRFGFIERLYILNCVWKGTSSFRYRQHTREHRRDYSRIPWHYIAKIFDAERWLTGNWKFANIHAIL